MDIEYIKSLGYRITADYEYTVRNTKEDPNYDILPVGAMSQPGDERLFNNTQWGLPIERSIEIMRYFVLFRRLKPGLEKVAVIGE